MLLSPPPRRTSCNNNIAPFFIESVALHAHGSQTDNQLHANPISKTRKSKSKWRLQLAPALGTPNPASSRPSPLPPPPPKPRPTPPSRATPKSPSRKLPRAQIVGTGEKVVGDVTGKPGKKAAGTRKARGTDSMTTKRAPRTKKAVV
ncbi:hypothetical protein HBH99_065310 [Parastagonospora nodorum]|nr:hypothetical protein HBI05_185550 [Parastagonospora nodorum]KAH4389998.1 hypothetical protein HBH97_046490 [Parastagonospora nodorum]KAH4414877.1 hypothetical protein HBH99_065310 [Parastagonospora nodorum]